MIRLDSKDPAILGQKSPTVLQGSAISQHNCRMHSNKSSLKLRVETPPNQIQIPVNPLLLSLLCEPQAQTSPGPTKPVGL